MKSEVAGEGMEEKGTSKKWRYLNKGQLANIPWPRIRSESGIVIEFSFVQESKDEFLYSGFDEFLA